MMNINDEAPHAGWWKRIGWLVAIWVLSVAALGVAAFMLKWTMRAVGLAS